MLIGRFRFREMFTYLLESLHVLSWSVENTNNTFDEI